MARDSFMDLYGARSSALDTVVCVGLDPKMGFMPAGLDEVREFHRFGSCIIDATKAHAATFKPNVAFYAKHGTEGQQQLKWTIDYLHRVAPDIPVLLDFKRGDIGDTNAGYVAEALEYFEADGVTIHNFLGLEAMRPFLDQERIAVFVLCRTSNKGSDEFQCLTVETPDGRSMPLFAYIAERIADAETGWNYNGNCGLVAGATYPEDVATIRSIIGSEMPLLLPGFGKQGGDVEKAVKAGLNSVGGGIIANSSSGIIFASRGEDFASAAARAAGDFKDELNRYRKEGL